MALKYADAFLAKHCTSDREGRAFDYVDALGIAGLPDDWRDRLATLRCYVIACLENQADPEDLYAAKLKGYREEFDGAMALARAAANAVMAATTVGGDVMPVFSIPLERA